MVDLARIGRQCKKRQSGGLRDDFGKQEYERRSNCGVGKGKGFSRQQRSTVEIYSHSPTGAFTIIWRWSLGG
ncbi:hypothetical protein M378DRAFT_166368 [Amanita muscaria Koide BX008]|uniref:Uncharacterized protein n=1 Tax=Amanita muscaria (strain Koide BX008) TaxID=946122 RepID=A0A0C2WYG1_AMAMK|nr:hypothetical protein M378DRAFT_166368 [Amanita muscaria Koide BX008]